MDTNLNAIPVEGRQRVAVVRRAGNRVVLDAEDADGVAVQFVSDADAIELRQ